MEIVESGTYEFRLDVNFPATTPYPFKLAASMARRPESAACRGTTGKLTLKELIEKDALVRRLLAGESFEVLASQDLTVTRVELIPTAGPTVEEEVVLDRMACIRVATKHVDSCVACQDGQYCEAGEPIF
ncbi:hypothetical protein ACFU96_44785 [Streptomyces sp. NPDC057620]|uniref:hypothetical protein n=1 Tax=Streptomyces sp. NPDC057620 TaxID=3346185 RepID=UPI0036B0D745